MKRLVVMACLLFLLSFLVDCSSILLHEKSHEIQSPANEICTEQVVYSTDTDPCFV